MIKKKKKMKSNGKKETEEEEEENDDFGEVKRFCCSRRETVKCVLNSLPALSLFYNYMLHI
jgi:hypothetical protein